MAGSKTWVTVLVLFAIACSVLEAGANSPDDKVRMVETSGIQSVSAGELRAISTGSRRRSLLQSSLIEPSLVRHRSEPNCHKKPGICKNAESKGPSCCYGKCVNEQTDIHNCGQCGRVVPKNFSCCKGHPANLSTSPYNCGKCGVRCPGNQKCEFGTCNYAS